MCGLEKSGEIKDVRGRTPGEVDWGRGSKGSHASRRWVGAPVPGPNIITSGYLFRFNATYELVCSVTGTFISVLLAVAGVQWTPSLTV